MTALFLGHGAPKGHFTRTTPWLRLVLSENHFGIRPVCFTSWYYDRDYRIEFLLMVLALVFVVIASISAVASLA
jgi:hypothetical protein